MNRTRRAAARPLAVADASVRLTGVLLALAVAAVHVADQGGVANFTSPDWLGWAYRLIEVGGLLTALALLLPRPAWAGWAAGVLLGVAPFVGYIVSRSIGVPGDADDIGNWSDWTGTVSLVLEAALVVLSVGMLLAARAGAHDQDGYAAPAAGEPRPLKAAAGL